MRRISPVNDPVKNPTVAPIEAAATGMKIDFL